MALTVDGKLKAYQIAETKKIARQWEIKSPENFKDIELISDTNQ